MCIFVRPVTSVAKTRIFASAGIGASRFTAYQMTTKSAGNAKNRNAMILPVPTTGNITLHDLSAVPKMFDDLGKLYERNRMVGRARGPAMKGAMPRLAVHDVGSYKVSIVPAISDFSKLDFGTFALNGAVGNTLRRFYSHGFAFVVAILTRDGEIHPLGYSYDDTEPSRLFVPTRHEHGDTGLPHWDHHLYVPDDVLIPTSEEDEADDDDENVYEGDDEDSDDEEDEGPVTSRSGSAIINAPTFGDRLYADAGAMLKKVSAAVPAIEPFLPVSPRGRCKVQRFTFKGTLPNLDVELRLAPTAE